jgi:hypothetical protein
MAKSHDKTIHIGGGLVGRGLVRGAFGGGGLVRGDFGGRNLTSRGLRGGTLAEALDAMATGHVDRDFSQVKHSIDRLAKADPKDVQEVAASQLQLIAGCQKIVVSQASRCFFWGLVGTGIGLGFFVVAALYSIVTGNAAAAMVPALSGSVIAAVAGVLFYLYGRTTGLSRCSGTCWPTVSAKASAATGKSRRGLTWLGGSRTFQTRPFSPLHRNNPWRADSPWPKPDGGDCITDRSSVSHAL